MPSSKTQKIKNIILAMPGIIFLGALLFFQLYWIAIMLGGMILGLGLVAGIVFAALTCVGMITVTQLPRRSKLLGMLILFILAVSLWIIGISRGAISDGWTGRIDIMAYVFLLIRILDDHLL